LILPKFYGFRENYLEFAKITHFSKLLFVAVFANVGLLSGEVFRTLVIAGKCKKRLV